MKDLKKYNELLKTLPKEKYFDSFYEKEYEIYSIKDLKKLAELKYSDTERYLCMKDLQGANYCEGCNFTAKDWCLKALDYCDTDTLYLTAQQLVLGCNNEQEMIDLFSDYWQFEIVKSTPEHIKELQEQQIEIVNEYF